MKIKNTVSNKNFGLTFFIVFIIISLWPLIHGEQIRVWSLAIAFIFLILGMLNSKILTPLNTVWFKFGLFLGKIVSPIVMGIIFFLIVCVEIIWSSKEYRVLRVLKWLNVFGTSGSGKTHLSKILEKKINKVKIINAEKINNNTLDNLCNLNCLIIDNYRGNIDEELFYSLLNQSKQLDNFILINSIKPIKKNKFELTDLKSRVESFLYIGIQLPTDDLLKVIISKSFSDKQIILDPKISSFIIKNVERSYDNIFKFLKEIDDLSLSSGKSININLIKKVIQKKNE